MKINNMTEGPKTPCFFFPSGYLQDSPVIGSSKLKMLSNIQVLTIDNPGISWRYPEVKKKQRVLGPSVMLFIFIPYGCFYRKITSY